MRGFLGPVIDSNDCIAYASRESYSICSGFPPKGNDEQSRAYFHPRKHIYPGEQPMASLTIRNIDESIKNNLRIRAAEHGRSMEEEARQILMHHVLSAQSAQGIGSRVSRRFAAVGGIDLPELSRSTPRQFERVGNSSECEE